MHDTPRTTRPAGGPLGQIGAPINWDIVFAPNQTGTYTVGPNGSITLHFLDGTTQTYTFAAEGPDPSTTGILLDQTSYTPPSSG
jgi:hypothetical protein